MISGFSNTQYVRKGTIITIDVGHLNLKHPVIRYILKRGQVDDKDNMLYPLYNLWYRELKQQRFSYQ